MSQAHRTRRRKKYLSLPAPGIGKIEALSHEGLGITTVNGKKVFVFGALKDEMVSFEYKKSHTRYDEADIIQVQENISQDRATPPCAYYGLCGGCQWQHVKAEKQIYLKEQMMLEQLAHLGKVEPMNILPPLTGPQTGYRHKARLGVRYVHQKSALLIGFRERSSNKLAMIDSCAVLHPAVGARIGLLKSTVALLEGHENIPQIEIAVGDDNVVAMIVRYLSILSQKDIQILSEFCYKNNWVLYGQPKGPTTVHQLYPKQLAADSLENTLQYTLDIKLQSKTQAKTQNKKLVYTFHPLDFTQVNPEINQKMVNLALELLAPTNTETVLDLFCGLGNFSLALALLAKRVIGVEGDEKMVWRAGENAKNNNILNAEFFSANLFEAEKLRLDKPQWFTKVDKLLLDPPRTGALEIISVIEYLAPKAIVYVSCNPATFARDAGVLVNEKGYRLEQVGVMDMFPHTHHVETIGLFTHGKST